MPSEKRYARIIEKIFFRHYKSRSSTIRFRREEIITVAKELRIDIPKNLGDLVYSFRYRAALPESVSKKAPKGTEWVIRPDGPAKYKFVALPFASITPSSQLAETKVPDSTPGVIESYALSDEQALLAKIRYNRLIDIFTGLTCYSLQNHLRTQVKGIGQVETDEVYVGLDKRGVHHVLPVQAKGPKDKIGIVQIEQDAAVCKSKFPALLCRPIAAQLIRTDLIALFEIELSKTGISISSEKHYWLVPAENISKEELLMYRKRFLQ